MRALPIAFLGFLVGVIATVLVTVLYETEVPPEAPNVARMAAFDQLASELSDQGASGEVAQVVAARVPVVDDELEQLRADFAVLQQENAKLRRFIDDLRTQQPLIVLALQLEGETTENVHRRLVRSSLLHDEKDLQSALAAIDAKTIDEVLKAEVEFHIKLRKKKDKQPPVEDQRGRKHFAQFVYTPFAVEQLDTFCNDLYSRNLPQHLVEQFRQRMREFF